MSAGSKYTEIQTAIDAAISRGALSPSAADLVRMMLKEVEALHQDLRQTLADAAIFRAMYVMTLEPHEQLPFIQENLLIGEEGYDYTK